MRLHVLHATSKGPTGTSTCTSVPSGCPEPNASIRPRSALRALAVIIPAVAATGFDAASAAGFDCRQAGSSVERLICSDPTLSDLDSTLKGLYDQVERETFGHEDFTGKVIDPVGGEQRLWLRTIRNACADTVCLRRVYSARIAALRALAPIAGTYVRKDAHIGGGSLTLRPSGARWRVSAAIGGIPDGAATHADCRFDVDGIWSGSAFHGIVLPDDTDMPEPGTGAKRPPDFSFTIEGAQITVKATDPMVCNDDRVVVDGVYRKALQ